MLAYYTSLLRREEILMRIAQDGKDLSIVTNDLVCLLKEFVVSCETRDVESSHKLISESEDLAKTIVAMTANLKENYDSYLVSLVPNKESKQEDLKSEEKQKPPAVDNNQLSTLLETVKSLKEMKDSINK